MLDSTSLVPQDFVLLIPIGTRGMMIYPTMKVTHVPVLAMIYSRWHAYIGLLQDTHYYAYADLYRSDGQKRSVYIYRFLTAGTIDGESLSAFRAKRVANAPYTEKIYQRQITKLGLSSSTLCFSTHVR